MERMEVYSTYFLFSSVSFEKESHPVSQGKAKATAMNLSQS